MVLTYGYGARRQTVRAFARAGFERRQRAGRIVPVSTRLPDEAGFPLAFCCVTVSVAKPVGGTPDQSVTCLASLNVPTGTRMPAELFSHAS